MKTAQQILREYSSTTSCKRAVGLVLSSAFMLSCIAEAPAEELGVAQFKRGQPVPGVTPMASSGPAKAAEEPMRNAAPSSTQAATATRSEMAPAQAQGPAAGAPAAPSKAQQMMSPVSAQAPVAGGAAMAGRAAAPTAGAAAPTVTESTGSSAAGAAAPPDKAADPAAPGMLSVAFMSVGPGGRYAPRNCGAVWIEDESGKFVKTIERWTAIRERYLESWSMASGGWGFSIFGGSSGGNNPDQVDVVSAGTLSRHQMHMSTWNMKNREGAVVPDGKYTVVVEVSEGNSGVGRVDFVKGPMNQMLTGDSKVFSNMTVTYSR